MSEVSNTNVYPILKAVSECFDIPIAELKGGSRKRVVVVPRCVAMHEMRQHTNMSLKRIGKIFKKDHATVVYSVNLYEELAQFNVEFKWYINQYKQYSNY